MGVDAPADRPIDGVDILPLLSDPSSDRPKPIPYRFLDRKDKMFDAPTFAVMDGQWKFLTNLDAAGAHDQLYDMVADLGETTNVLDEHPDLQRMYREQLTEFLDSCRRSHAGDDYDRPVDMVTPFQEPGGWAD